MAAAKLNDHAVRQIRRLVSEDSHTQQAVAKMFGIDQTTVSKIVLRVSWKHVK
jgi:predicted XRE-type DNA-binding protein